MRAAQVKEYGTYVAVQPINYGVVRVYNVGDPVPVSNVERHGYLEQGLVAKVTTKAAAQAVGAAGGESQS